MRGEASGLVGEPLPVGGIEQLDHVVDRAIDARDRGERLRVAAGAFLGILVAAALMTPPNQAVLSWSEHEEAVRMLAGDVWTFRPNTPGVHGPRPTGAWFGEAWDTLTSLEPVLNMAERAFRLERVIPVLPILSEVWVIVLRRPAS